MVLDFYKKAQQVLQEEQRFVLMVVIANEGSSPGRKGFKMLVTKNQMFGTIGGGIMEHKLVDYAQRLLTKTSFEPFIKHQIHDKSAPADQSGMICSGRQTIAFYDITTDCLPTIDSIITQDNVTISYSNLGIDSKIEDTETLAWYFEEKNSLVQKVYIIGGGHVGLALSEVLSHMDFEIHVLDHRENLNTMMMNTFAHSKQTVAFEEIENYIPEGDSIYVVVMSFGYRTDDVIIRRLINKNFRYIGMLGSKEKIATLFQNMIADGYDKSQISKVYAPIGIDIKSETTQEIAISVASQLISVKNRN
ncbi:XdhC family protein [Flavobacterium psychrotolerans]|uniref:Xanthine dehydrogenase n=1 Tax=Flavobacterium psychrotolerans TaxID=2169410 RepID=A0A2U1JFN0_9FLAO|nr:XdhC/CoxI family protein [Flavobacterium psychrotolerans]PWA03911.1 xanthine dehydrogenase [Flavobacterium psychrotolerans]